MLKSGPTLPLLVSNTEMTTANFTAFNAFRLNYSIQTNCKKACHLWDSNGRKIYNLNILYGPYTSTFHPFKPLTLSCIKSIQFSIKEGHFDPPSNNFMFFSKPILIYQPSIYKLSNNEHVAQLTVELPSPKKSRVRVSSL